MFHRGLKTLAGAVTFSVAIGSGLSALAAPDVEAGASPGAVQKAEERDPKVCKRFKPTGSNISKTFCFRKSKWDTMREESQRGLRDLSDQSAVNTRSAEGSR